QGLWKMFKKPRIAPIIFAGLTCVWGVVVHADSAPVNPSVSQPGPWEKFSFSMGAFFTNSDTGIRLGSNVGVEMDLEDTLGFNSNASVFRTEAAWRFSPNRRHRLDASWFAVRRDAQT